MAGRGECLVYVWDMVGLARCKPWMLPRLGDTAEGNIYGPEICVLPWGSVIAWQMSTKKSAFNYNAIIASCKVTRAC